MLLISNVCLFTNVVITEVLTLTHARACAHTNTHTVDLNFVNNKVLRSVVNGFRNNAEHLSAAIAVFVCERMQGIKRTVKPNALCIVYCISYRRHPARRSCVVERFFLFIGFAVMPEENIMGGC